MASTRDQITELLTKVDEAWALLKLDDVVGRVKELEAQMASPDFWSDQEKARGVSQEAAGLKEQLEAWSSLRDELSSLRDLEEVARQENDDTVIEDVKTSLDHLQGRYADLEHQTLFRDTLDVNNALVSVHAGAGGTDAMDWAAMVFRMLTRFAEQKGFTVELLEESRGEEAGYKKVAFAMRGRYAYGSLKSEAGVHRLVRISPFDAEKMRHTAFALVEVIPELDALSEKQLEIDEKDLRIDTFMSSGKGGQSVNTTYSAVRITHEPTGLVVSCQNERSQLQNKETALRVLKSRLFQMMLDERAEKLEELKGGHKAPEWGNQIRSYVLHPYKMVKDHRTKVETQDVEGVLNGALEPFIQGYLKQQAGEAAAVEDAE